MDNEQSVEEFLEHYGVPGMRWGHRRALTVENSKQLQRDLNALQKSGQGNNLKAINKAASAYDARYKQIKNTYNKTNTAARIERSGGSKGKAVGKILAKGFAQNLLLTAGVHTIAHITKSPQITRGAATVAGFTRMGLEVKNIVDIVKVVKYKDE